MDCEWIGSIVMGTSYSKRKNSRSCSADSRGKMSHVAQASSLALPQGIMLTASVTSRWRFVVPLSDFAASAMYIFGPEEMRQYMMDSDGFEVDVDRPRSGGLQFLGKWDARFRMPLGQTRSGHGMLLQKAS